MDPENNVDTTTLTDPAALAPESDVAAAAAAVAEPDKPEAQAPEGDTPFRLEDVPEEYREHVTRYNRQLQADYTRKSQELAQQRKEVEAIASLKTRLDSDDDRTDALRELLSQYGYELDEESTNEEIAAAAVDHASGGQAPQTDLERRLAALEAERAAEQESDERAEYLGRVQDSIDDGLDALASELGKKRSDLSDHQEQQVLAIARALPLVDGLPNMEAAVAQYLAWQAAEIQAYVDSKRVAQPDTAGVAGAPKFDARDPKARLEAMNAIAARALG